MPGRGGVVRSSPTVLSLSGDLWDRMLGSLLLLGPGIEVDAYQPVSPCRCLIRSTRQPQQLPSVDLTAGPQLDPPQTDKAYQNGRVFAGLVGVCFISFLCISFRLTCVFSCAHFNCKPVKDNSPPRPSSQVVMPSLACESRNPEGTQVKRHGLRTPAQPTKANTKPQSHTVDA